MISRFLAVLSLLALAVAASGQEPDLRYYFEPGLELDPEIPPPSSVLGWEVGTWHARHDQLVSYLTLLAERSPRVRIEVTGHTHEQRPLLLLTVTSPENQDRLEALREAHLRRSDRPDDPAAKGPLVVWLGYGVHGNEPGASNAALLVAYLLAAGRGPEIETLLRDAVILVEPCLNPDGHARFAQWANMHKGQVLVGDPRHREHREAWPSGRTNHYWFDLNRDWLPAQQPESRARLRVFHRWRPHVVTDHHEMGTDSTFFFQPGVPSRTNPLTPERNQRLTAMIAEEHAKVLDADGRVYFSEEQYDDFYYGKGSTYPDVNGGVGILFEQGSSRGHLQESVNGPVAFPSTIKSQLLVSRSTLAAAWRLREELSEWQREFYRTARFEAAADPVKAWVFGAAHDPELNREMVDLLLRHRIAVFRLKRDGEFGERRFEAGRAWIVPAGQPQYRLAKTLFERRLAFEDETFYDVSAWTLPLAFDMPFAELDATHDLEEWEGERVPNPFLGSEPLRKPSAPAAEPPARDPGTVAYAVDWRARSAPRVLHRLLEGGLRVRVATAPFTAKEVGGGAAELPAGTILVPLGLQDDEAGSVHARVVGAAAASGVAWRALATGLTPVGPDLGSRSMAPLEPLRPALLVGGGISAYDAGEIWHLLDHRMGVGVTLLEIDELPRADLERYSHLIMVGGAYSGISEATRDELRRWVRRGGVVVATESACAWAGRELLGIEPSKEGAGADESSREANPESRVYADRLRDRSRRLVSGTIFEGLIDATHPIGFGYDDGRLALFKTSAAVMPNDRDGLTDVVRYPARDPVLAGFCSEANRGRIAGTAAVNARRLGRGAVVRLLDNPAFRGYWHGGTRLFMNALFFAKVVRDTGGEESDEGEDG